MIISRKDYERALRVARAEGRKEAKKEQEIRRQIDSVEQSMWNNVQRMCERIDKIGDKVCMLENQPKECKCHSEEKAKPKGLGE